MASANNIFEVLHRFITDVDACCRQRYLYKLIVVQRRGRVGIFLNILRASLLGLF